MFERPRPCERVQRRSRHARLPASAPRAAYADRRCAILLRMKTRRLLALWLLLGCSGRAAPPRAVESLPVTHEMHRAAEAVTGELLREHVRELASDRYEGRGPMTPGGELAMQYLERQLRALGFAPGASDGSYRQPFPLLGLSAEPPATWTFARGNESVTLRGTDQYIVGCGDQAEHTDVGAREVVFVGYGMQAPEYGWDDYKGRDLRGKVLLMLNNDPDWDDALFAGKTRLYYGRWTYKYESAARQGAVGAIVIHTTPSAGYPFTVVQTSWSGEQFELARGDEPRLAFRSWITEAAAQELLKLAGRSLDDLVATARSRDFSPVPLGVTTSISFSTTLRRGESANVVGKLEGSDPALRDEVVVYTAHHDHLGIGKADAEGDRIYNGALDNAAGVAQVLAIARALQALPTPPRRSSLITFVGAEEQGLLGSLYYARHPTYEPGAIAANVNYDFGNMWGRTRDISFVGMEKSTLGALVSAIARVQGRVVKPDVMPDRGYFYRSDNFSFARIGVPSASFSEGMEVVDRPEGWGRQQVERYEAARYHQPSDEYDDSWNFDGMVDDARLGFWVGVSVANADEMPRWTAGDEFEATRHAARAAWEAKRTRARK
jgi:Zn-dependent M28 family amino/carboxypeptidase